jgi:hypothetical protein
VNLRLAEWQRISSRTLASSGCTGTSRTLRPLPEKRRRSTSHEASEIDAALGYAEAAVEAQIDEPQPVGVRDLRRPFPPGPRARGLIGPTER